MLLRVVGFGGGDADQLKAAEGEHDHRHRHHQAHDAVREEPALRPQVGDGGLRAAHAAEQQIGAEHDHADNRHHLDDGEPELHLAVNFDVGQVDGVDRQEEHRGGDPGGDLRPPVLHVDTDRGQLRHRHQDIQHPVVPAGSEAGEVAPVFVGEVAEGTSNRLFHHHFPQLAHDQKRDEATDGVTENNRRAGHFYCLSDTEK